jgi:hypothetical protein
VYKAKSHLFEGKSPHGQTGLAHVGGENVSRILRLERVAGSDVFFFQTNDSIQKGLSEQYPTRSDAIYEYGHNLMIYYYYYDYCFILIIIIIIIIVYYCYCYYYYYFIIIIIIIIIVIITIIYYLLLLLLLLSSLLLLWLLLLLL